MRSLSILFAFLWNVLGINAQIPDNTALSKDTSQYKFIRNRISDQTFFVKADPSAANYIKRAQLKGQMEDWQGALDDLDQALKLNKNEGMIFYFRGAANERLGRLEESLKDFTKVTEMAPDYDWGWNDRAQILIKLGRLKEAEDDLKKALELHPGWHISTFNLGLKYEKEKEFTKALEYYNQSLKADSSNYMAYNNIGYIHFQLKEYESAISNYSKAIDLYPPYTNALRNRADAKLAAGDKKGACEDVRKAAELGDRHALDAASICK